MLIVVELLEEKKCYKNGKLEGSSTTWLKSGKRLSEIYYKDGWEVAATWWHESGQKESVRYYKTVLQLCRQLRGK